MSFRTYLISITLLLLLTLLPQRIQSISFPFRNILSSWKEKQVGVRLQGYKTEPTFLPQKFKVEYLTKDKTLFSPGYIFVAMMWKLEAPFGPQIYDMDGEPIWYGSVLKNRIQDFKVCDYNRTRHGLTEPHLCWSEREVNRKANKPYIHKVLVANDYTLIWNKTLRSDLHELNLVDDGKSLATMDYTWTKKDLSQWNGPKKGVFKDACIMEYDLDTFKVNFEWCYSHYLPLWETKIFFHATPQVNETSNIAGSGKADSPWDPIHINAVDKNQDGDYIGSFRHLNQIMKIAGPKSASGKKPGTVLWRLGGFSNQFKTNFNFSMQHDIRYVRTDAKGDTISLFDNAWEGVNKPSAKYSAGKLIRVENKTMKAHLIHEYPHPRGELAKSRGSMQVLDNGNAFVGWGAMPEFTEYDLNGKPIYHARFDTDESKQFSYRSFKFPWVGHPPQPPKVIAYTHKCLEHQQPLYVYVSWNGATEVRQWRVSTSYTEHGPWIPAGVYEKHGFETRMKVATPAPYVQVQALDTEQNALSTAMAKTFVPHVGLRHKCDEFGCPNHFEYKEKASRTDQCDIDLGIAWFPLAVFLLFIEVVVRSGQNAVHTFVVRKAAFERLYLFD